MQNYRIYADICCLNRPLDALQQPRVKLESDDRLLKKATKQTDLITIPTANPVIWLMNTLQE
jgi:hypothetical protein